MEVAPRNTLLTMLTLFLLFKLLYIVQTVEYLPVYIVREGRTILEWAAV